MEKRIKEADMRKIAGFAIAALAGAGLIDVPTADFYDNPELFFGGF